METSKPVRIGVIGYGVMGRTHAKALSELPAAQLTAVADADASSCSAAAETYGVRTFSDGDDLIDSDQIDAVIIATPHYDHPRLAEAALARGLHVLSEKPLAVDVKAARRVVDVAAGYPQCRFGVNFQMRSRPLWRTVKQQIVGGAVGELMRVRWTATKWFRSQAYYDSGGWRATWAGEGGGVLINQCPHNLDLLCWLLGSPAAVTAAHVGLGRHHNIEVEDEVVALLAYPNGAPGVFTTSTAEMPGVNQLEIVGDRGTLLVSDGSIELFTNSVSSKEYLRTTDETMKVPSTAHQTVEPIAAGEGEPSEVAGGGLRAMVYNFVQAINGEAELICPAAEAVASLELANAMLMSGLKREPVALPMDGDAYEQLLAGLVRDAAATSTVAT